MNPTNERSSVGTNVLIGLALAVLVTLMLVDLTSEIAAGTSGLHIVVELCAILAGAVAVAAIARRMRELLREAHDLRAGLASSNADAQRWARQASNLIEGLAGAIDDQLERWHLSAAEKEVALLLLKGLEHKGIAQLREVAETTVRQQARSLYRKAGLAGRHELAAFFLEDLLGPRTHEARAGAAPSSAP